MSPEYCGQSATQLPITGLMALGTKLALVLVVLSHLPHVAADPDLWGHLKFGLDHVASGRLASVEPYSYTAQGQPWTNHEWLCEWLFAVVYNAAGPIGLVTLRGLLLLTCLGALGLIARRRSTPWMGVLLWSALAVPILSEFYRIRPQMFTYAAMAVLVNVCDNHAARGGRGFWFLPALFVAWTNLHAGFVAGLGILGVQVACWTGDAIRQQRSWDVARQAWVVLTASVIATLLNPYGLEYWRFVLFAISLPRVAIGEWGPALAQNWVVASSYLVLAMVPVVLWAMGNRRTPVSELLALAIGMLVAGKHVRHVPFLIIFASLVVFRNAGPAWDTFSKRLIRWIPRPQVVTWFLSPVFVVAAISGFGARAFNEFQRAISIGPVTLSEADYPVHAVEFLRRSSWRGNLDCGFNWGEYGVFHLYPQFRVFCDGRYETAYPSSVSDLVLVDRNDPSAWPKRLRGYQTDVVLLPVDDPFCQWVGRQPDFVEVYRDTTARVLARIIDPAARTVPAQRPGQAVTSLVGSVPFPG